MSGYSRPMRHRGGYGREYYRSDPLDAMPRRDGFPTGSSSSPFPGMDPLAVQALVIVIDPERRCRAYAEMFLSKLKKVGLICDIMIIDDFTSPSQVVDDATARGLLYAASVNLQNEMHQSVTINILQGQPQEHRNMPYEDALKLVSRNFDAHLLKLGGAKADVDEVPMMPGMQDKNLVDEIDPTLSLLLINLAEGKRLKLADLDKVINFVNDKRAKLSSKTGEENLSPAPRNIASVAPDAPKPVQPPASGQSVSSQAENLQAKINQLFGGPSKQQSAIGVGFKSPVGTESKPNSVDPAKKTVGIDFNNPTVQNALQNLMKTGPSILESIRSNTESGTTSSLSASTAEGMREASDGWSRNADNNTVSKYSKETSHRPVKSTKPGKHAIAGFY